TSLLLSAVFPSVLRRPLSSPLFPYTTLFRSHEIVEKERGIRMRGVARDADAAHARDRRLQHEPVDRRALTPGGFRHEVVDRERRSEEHTSELQSRFDLVCRLLLEKKKKLDRGRRRYSSRTIRRCRTPARPPAREHVGVAGLGDAVLALPVLRLYDLSHPLCVRLCC